MQIGNNKFYLCLIFTVFFITTDASGMMKTGSRSPDEGGRLSRSFRPPEEPIPASRISAKAIFTMPTLYDPERDMCYQESLTLPNNDGAAAATITSLNLEMHNREEILEQACAKLKRQLEEQKTLSESASSKKEKDLYLQNIKVIESSLELATELLA